MNNVILIGRLTREPELKYSSNGVGYCRISLAVNRMKKEDPADFINCIGFGKTAELICQYVKKGNRLGVQGRIQTSNFEVEGVKKYRTDVMIEKIEFLESKGNEKNIENDLKKSDNKSYQNNPKIQPTEEEEDEFPF